MATEKFGVSINVDAADALKNLKSVNSSADNAKKSLDELGTTGSKSAGMLSASFSNLARSFAAIVSIGGVAMMIKRFSEANLRMQQLAARSNTADKSIRALGNAFKVLGYSSNEAEASVEGFAKSFADYKFSGKLGGIAESFAAIGVQIMDAKGNARDFSEMLIEAGEKAMQWTGGKRQDAQQLLMSRGFTAAQADVATRPNARAEMDRLKQQAAASAELAKQHEKLNKSINDITESFLKLFLKLDEKFGIFKKINDVLTTFSDWITKDGDNALIFFGLLGAAVVAATAPFIVLAGKIALAGAAILAAWNLGKKFIGWLQSIGPGGTPSTQVAVDQEALTNAGNGLLDSIGKGEGTYNSVNLGKAGGYKSSTRDLTGMTIGQVLEAQGRKEFNAAGKYQFIPATLKRVAGKSGISLDARFTPEIQDKLAMTAMREQKAVRDYLDNKSSDVNAAVHAMAGVWASIKSPYTGKGRYDSSFNRATIDSSVIASQLTQIRNDTASGNKTTNINIYAPSGDAKDIKNSFVAYMGDVAAFNSGF